MPPEPGPRKTGVEAGAMEMEQLRRLSQPEGGVGVGYLRARVGRVRRCGWGSTAALLPVR